MTDEEVAELSERVKKIDMNWVYHQICTINTRFGDLLSFERKVVDLMRRMRTLEAETHLALNPKKKKRSKKKTVAKKAVKKRAAAKKTTVKKPAKRKK